MAVTSRFCGRDGGQLVDRGHPAVPVLLVFLLETMHLALRLLVNQDKPGVNVMVSIFRDFQQ
jgi:hypothetical protein